MYIHIDTYIYIPASVETISISVPQYKYKLHKKITCLKIKDVNTMPNLTNKLKCLEIITDVFYMMDEIFTLPNKLTYFRYESNSNYQFNFPNKLHVLVLKFSSNYTDVLIFPKSLKYMSLIFYHNFSHHIQFPSKLKYLSFRYNIVPKYIVSKNITHLHLYCTKYNPTKHFLKKF